MHALHAPLRCAHISAVLPHPQHFQDLGHPLQSCPAFLLPDSQLEVAPLLEKGAEWRARMGVFCTYPRA